MFKEILNKHPTAVFFGVISWLIASWFFDGLIPVLFVTAIGSAIGHWLER